MNCAKKIGSGPWSTSAVYHQTLENGNRSAITTRDERLFFVVPDLVENLTFSDVYDTSLDITWQRPIAIQINRQFVAYELEWCPLNSSSSDRSLMKIPPQSTTFTIENLSAMTWLVFDQCSRQDKERLPSVTFRFDWVRLST